MDELATFHVSPPVIGPVACGRILGATTSRFATELPTFAQGAGTEVIQGVDGLADARDALTGSPDDGFRTERGNGVLTVGYLSVLPIMCNAQAPSPQEARFALKSERLGPLPSSRRSRRR